MQDGIATLVPSLPSRCTAACRAASQMGARKGKRAPRQHKCKRRCCLRPVGQRAGYKLAASMGAWSVRGLDNPSIAPQPCKGVAADARRCSAPAATLLSRLPTLMAALAGARPSGGRAACACVHRWQFNCKVAAVCAICARAAIALAIRPFAAWLHDILHRMPVCLLQHNLSKAAGCIWCGAGFNAAHGDGSPQSPWQSHGTS